MGVKIFPEGCKYSNWDNLNYAQREALFLKVVLNLGANKHSSLPNFNFRILTFLLLQYLSTIMTKAFLPVIFLLLTFLACKQYEEDLLSGTWRGSAVTEADKPLDIEPSSIKLILDPDGSYRYESTLNYQEAGTYFLDQQYLYTMDTINQASTEKAVEIILLSPDSLHLRMNEAGKERLLKMVREM